MGWSGASEVTSTVATVGDVDLARGGVRGCRVWLDDLFAEHDSFLRLTSIVIGAPAVESRTCA